MFEKSTVEKDQTMNKKKPCGLDSCPQEEIVGAYASCSACAWGNDCDDESEGADDETIRTEDI